MAHFDLPDLPDASGFPEKNKNILILCHGGSLVNYNFFGRLWTVFSRNLATKMENKDGSIHKLRRSRRPIKLVCSSSNRRTETNSSWLGVSRIPSGSNQKICSYNSKLILPSSSSFKLHTLKPAEACTKRNRCECEFTDTTSEHLVILVLLYYYDQVFTNLVFFPSPRWPKIFLWIYDE